MSRHVLLVDIGSDPLPAVTPVRDVPAPWVPEVYVPPPMPAPTGVLVTSVVDGARIDWTPAAVPGVTTQLETAPDVDGSPGSWLAGVPTTDSTVTLSLPGDARWIRLRTVVNGRKSDPTVPILASRIIAATKEELDVVESKADEAQEAAEDAQQTADHADALTQPGSGVQLGDQRNLLPTTVSSVRSLWEGLTLSATYDTASPAEVTLTASAATLRVGSASTSYDSANTKVTQARGTVARYYGYYLDAAWEGGQRLLNITTDEASLANQDGVVWVGEFAVAVPAAPTGGSGNTGSGGGSRPPGTIIQEI